MLTALATYNSLTAMYPEMRNSRCCCSRISQQRSWLHRWLQRPGLRIAGRAYCGRWVPGDEVVAVELSADEAAQLGDEMFDADHEPGAVLALGQQVAVHLIHDVANCLQPRTRARIIRAHRYV